MPQLVFAKLPQLEDDWLRVALHIIATGETDPGRIADALRLSGADKAREALLYWKGAGLLESTDAVSYTHLSSWQAWPDTCTSYMVS